MSEPVALGIMAYNEEQNIGRLLDSVLAQSASGRIAKIVVVASGCTDRTCEIVQSYAAREPRLALIAEPARSGKVAAINRFLFSATQEILMVSSADLIYDPHAVERLLAPLDDPEVGMVGAHSIPLDSTDTFFGYAVNLMWSLHHDISLRDPKMGELIAFRNVFRRLNPKAICDELSIHQLIRSAGYRSVYAADARIYNKGPETLDDFISQRMHCIVGNLQIMRDHNVPVSTMRTLPVLRAALPHALREWRKLHWTITAGTLELYCRLKAQTVYRSQPRATRYRVWDPAGTTKSLESMDPSTVAEKSSTVIR
ncbi:MAG: glycosyltransferase [Candidatus Eremiobacteraeota bacterium]|nr:glycosyltransferase [Candidatus Eremiobacteraeota bacterium]